MEQFAQHYDSWSNERLWNTIFQKTLVAGAILQIEGDDTIEKSLPFSRDTIEKTELHSNGRLVICYRKAPEGERNALIVPNSIRPIVNSDFSIISFSQTRIKNPNAEPEALETENLFISIERVDNSERPKILYHGSVNGDITEFMPRTAQERPDEKAAVYASPDIRIAKQSMANRFVSNGGIVNGRHFVCIPMTESEFRRVDQGGYIYELASGSFNVNSGYGFGDTEWISNEPVPPANKTYYPSILAELKKIGIEIFFINPAEVEFLTKLQREDTPDELEVYLNTLQGKNLL